MQYLTFLVGNECYAAGLADIAEIADIAAVISIPGQPAYATGLLQHMGRDLPVVDMRKLLGQDTSADSAKCVLVYDMKGAKLGLAVDKVEGVIVHSDPNALPEYITALENIELISPEQLHEVLDTRRWSEPTKKHLFHKIIGSRMLKTRQS